MSLAIYVASPLARASDARLLADALDREYGLHVCSNWHDNVTESVDPHDEATRRDVLTDNIADIERADVIVAIMDKGTPRATIGEIVWMISRGKRVVWLHGVNGEGRNLWDSHSLVTRVTDRAGILSALHLIERERGDASGTRLKTIPVNEAVEAFAIAAARLLSGECEKP